jgi:hypothetical protein
MRLEMAADIVNNNLTVKEVRRLVNKLCISDANESLEYHSLADLKGNRDLKLNRCFDKVLTTLKITQNKIGTIMLCCMIRKTVNLRHVACELC